MIYAQLIFAFALGAIIGSFLNVIIYRVPRGESIVYPGSHCPACEKALSFWMLVPILSYLLLKGRCGHCGELYSPYYFWVELITGLLFALILLGYGFTWESLFHGLLVAILLAITLIDWKHYIIPDSLNGAIALLALIGIFAGITIPLTQALLGALVGGGFLLLVALVFPQGMGGGDVKMVFALGLITGWQWVLLLLFLASLLGSIYGIINILHKGREEGRMIPFGPFLVTAALITIHWGDELVALYTGLLL
ncbi:leader peptidase (prepilin peptidase)/N-methyltransferase [Desulfitispora alkaliphila]|uniref:prepilin peptidase n=1 Tax=Desulfitispora alkaliphila TaxID=622674 RepID=UPI003D20CAF7